MKRFSILNVIMMTTVSALAVAWIADRYVLTQKLSRLTASRNNLEEMATLIRAEIVGLKGIGLGLSSNVGIEEKMNGGLCDSFILAQVIRSFCFMDESDEKVMLEYTAYLIKIGGFTSRKMIEESFVESGLDLSSVVDNDEFAFTDEFGDFLDSALHKNKVSKE